MRVLVTGASGYLGRHVVRALQRRGIDTVASSRNPDQAMQDCKFIEADLLHADSAAALIEQADATHLLHLGWYVEHGKYWVSPLNFEWVQASMRLVDAFCRQGGKRFVGAGTCAEYDWSYGYLHEELTPYRPTTVYGVAKNATRQLLREQCRSAGTSFAWGHVFFPFGLDEGHQRLVPSLMRVFQGQCDPFGVNANSFRGMLPVNDAAEGFVELLLSDQIDMVNICSGEPVSIAEIVRSVARIFDADPEPVLRLASARPDDPRVLVGNNQRLRSTGWLPKTSISQCLQNTLSLHHAT